MTASRELVLPAKVLVGGVQNALLLDIDTADLLLGIDSNVESLGCYSTKGGEPYIVTDAVAFPSDSDPVCAGIGALANFGLSVVFDPTRKDMPTVATVFLPSFDRTKHGAVEAVHAVMEFVNVRLGLYAAHQFGLMHVSRRLIEAVGYPDPTLPDEAVIHDYILRAFSADMMVQVTTKGRIASALACRALEAKYPGYTEAANAAAHGGMEALAALAKKSERNFIGPVAGLLDISEVRNAMAQHKSRILGSAPSAASLATLPETLVARVSAYIHQALQLTRMYS